jgi:hypothetical protein
MILDPSLDFLLYYPYNRARDGLIYRFTGPSGTSKNLHSKLQSLYSVLPSTLPIL